MKKFFPAIFISLVFTGLMISQMLINGQDLYASKVKKNNSLYKSFETKFKTIETISTKGNKVALKDVDKPIVIVNFWASWCRPCLTEFKSLNKFVEKYGEKAFVLGINNDSEDALKEVAKIEKKYKLKFDSINDLDGKYSEMFNITSIPTSIVFHNGKVLEVINKETDFMSKSFVDKIAEKLK